jgi:hypothetical protein
MKLGMSTLATGRPNRAPLWLVLLVTAVAFGGAVYVVYGAALACGENVGTEKAAADLCDVVTHDVGQIGIAVALPFAILLSGLALSRRAFLSAATLVLLAEGVLFAVIAAVAA